MPTLSAEVQKYYEEGPRKAISVVAEAPYLVSVAFDDGVTKEYDYSKAFTGVLSEIRDPEIFSKVYIDDMIFYSLGYTQRSYGFQRRQCLHLWQDEGINKKNSC